MASTTSLERKGFRFGMESSPASAEVKGSMQVEGGGGREDKKRGRGGRQSESNDGREKVGVRKRLPRVAPAAHLPRPSPPGAPSSRAAWTAGRRTAAQTGRSASSRRCGGDKEVRSDKPVTVYLCVLLAIIGTHEAQVHSVENLLKK